MANPTNRASLRRDMVNGQKPQAFHGRSPETSHKKLMRSNITKPAASPRTGDAVSDDEGSTGDDESDGTADEDDEDESDLDEPDGSALPGAERIGRNADLRLAGSTSEDDFMFDEDRLPSGASDDDYDGVEDVSDSEESAHEYGKKQIRRSAENDLIHEFERLEKQGATLETAADEALMRRGSLLSKESQQDYLDADLDVTLDPFGGLAHTDGTYQELLQDALVDFKNDNDDFLSSWRTPKASHHRDDNDPSNAAQKRVRFEATPSRTSSMSSEEDPREIYPDLFEEQMLRRQMTLNGMNMDVDDMLDAESVYDFDEDQAIAGLDDDEESDEESGASDSDFDSEDAAGDTTDEESEEVQIARMAAIRKAAGKEPPSAPNSAPSTPVPKVARLVLTRANSLPKVAASADARKKPRSGTFAPDPTRAIVVSDSSGNGIKVVCPSNPPEKDRAYWERARRVIGSRDGESPGAVSWTKRTKKSAAQQRPLTAKSTLGNWFGGDLGFLQDNDHAGITTSGQQQFVAGQAGTRSPFASVTLTEEEYSGGESEVDLSEFLHVDDSDSDMEEPPSEAVFSPMGSELSNDWAVDSSPMTTHRGLLGHFDQQRGLVSSFRNNQHIARHVSSLASNPAMRAETHEYNALQKGRRGAANTPMTPARKRRLSQELSLTGPPTGAGIRKLPASPLASRHRRGRGSSLSGLNSTLNQTLALDRFSSSRDHQPRQA